MQDVAARGGQPMGEDERTPATPVLDGEIEGARPDQRSFPLRAPGGAGMPLIRAATVIVVNLSGTIAESERKTGEDDIGGPFPNNGDGAAEAILRCTWCGNDVDPSEGYRLAEPAGGRGAVFCRLEHVVPWAMQGPHWEPMEPLAGAQHAPGACAVCEARLGDAQLVLVRHRAEHRISDSFCSVDHLSEWAKKGGRWRI